MQKLLQAIVSRISVSYKQLSVIKNPDGFLSDRFVQQAIEKESNICFVSGSSIELRCHFERTFKKDNSTKYCYLYDGTTDLLPDITEQAYIGKFAIADLFSNFMDKQVLKGLSFETLAHLHETNTPGFVSAQDAKMRIMQFEFTQPKVQKKTAAEYVAELDTVFSDACDWQEKMPKLSAVLANAIRDGYYADIVGKIGEINAEFQKVVLAKYTEAVTSNPMLKAKAVNKILPHLNDKYSSTDKVALVVVDGMAYWQYSVLKEHLSDAGIETEDSTIFSWMPSITMLSRQAIFRGDNPKQDYKQNPVNESKLWAEYWQGRGINASDIQYIYDGDDLNIYGTTKRLALVTVELDEKMHASTDNSDLMALTENWAKRFVAKVKAIKDAGFTIYLTTDHGNILARGWRKLTSQEKTFLYADGSRGERHLIYQNIDELNAFVINNREIEIQQHQNWLAFCDNGCFAKNGTEIITHGGTHLLEVLIPLVRI